MKSQQSKVSGLLSILLVSLLYSVNAIGGNVYKQTVNVSMEKVYPAVYKSLENARFYVVFEPDIGKNLSRFSEKWGDTYNQNNIDSIRSMVFCNGWYANAVSNADPDMLALCPLRISLYEKQGKTTVLFARPTVIAEQSAAKTVLLEVENEVIDAIKQGINGLKKKD